MLPPRILLTLAAIALALSTAFSPAAAHHDPSAGLSHAGCLLQALEPPSPASAATCAVVPDHVDIPLVPLFLTCLNERMAVEGLPDALQPAADAANLVVVPVTSAAYEQCDAFVRSNVGCDGCVSTSTSTNVHLGCVYEHANRGGKALCFAGGDGPCRSDGLVYAVPDLRAFRFDAWSGGDWNDRVSSFTGGYSNCWTVLFEHIYSGGSSLACWGYCNTLGAWNDRASSIIFR